MLKRRYASLLFDRGVPVTAIALYLAKPKEAEQIKGLLKKFTDIDLDDTNVMLTEEQIDQLKEFEQAYSQILLGMIIGNDLEDPWHTQQILHREMDLREQDIQNTNEHFRFTCWFGAVLVLLGFMYLFMITWIPIPPDQLRFADTGLGAIIGSIIQTVTNYFFILRQRNQKRADEQASYTESQIRSEEKKEETE